MEEVTPHDASGDNPGLFSVPDLPASDAAAHEAVESVNTEQPDLRLVQSDPSVVSEPQVEAAPEKIDYFAHLQDPPPAKAKSVIEAEGVGANRSGYDAHQVFAATPAGGDQTNDELETEIPEPDEPVDTGVAEAFDVEAFKENQTSAYPLTATVSAEKTGYGDLEALVPERAPLSTKLPWHRLVVYVIMLVVFAAVALRLLGLLGA